VAVIVLCIVLGLLLVGSLAVWWWMARQRHAAGPSPAAVELAALQAAARLDAATYAAECYMDEFIAQRQREQRRWSE
jgi:hypothetical protein